jgi:hypothetical protein
LCESGPDRGRAAADRNERVDALAFDSQERRILFDQAGGLDRDGLEQLPFRRSSGDQLGDPTQTEVLGRECAEVFAVGPRS